MVPQSSSIKFEAPYIVKLSDQAILLSASKYCLPIYLTIMLYIIYYLKINNKFKYITYIIEPFILDAQYGLSIKLPYHILPDE